MDLSTHIEQLKGFLGAEDILKHREDVKQIDISFKAYKASLEKAEDETESKEGEAVEAEETAKETETVVETQVDTALIEELDQLINTYKSKRDELLKQKKETEKANYEAKKKVIEDFRDLIQNEEHIGKAFERIKQIREDWKAIGDVSRDKYLELQNEYGKLSETFNYNIGIYKELKEHDLKTNFSLKNQIVHKINDLKKEKDIKVVEKELNRLRNEWDEIGGTYKDKWEIIKEKYWEGVRACYDKINAHYEDQRKVQAENLAAKQALIPKLEAAVAKMPENVKEWKSTTDAVLAIQKEWKGIGFSSRKETKPVWENFRAICNRFFDAKQRFFEQKKDKDSVQRDKKQALVDKANELKTSKDWRNTTEEMIKLQKQWKKIGHAGPHAEHKLWKAFRAACDEFFNAKDGHYKELESAFAENVDKKEAFIKDLASVELPASADEALEKIKSIGQEFAALGDIPSSQQKKVNGAYNKALQDKVNQLDLPEADKKSLLFRAKIQGMKDAGDDRGIADLRRDLQKAKRKIEDEINKQENNLGFFNISKGAEGLLAGVKSKIEDDKKEIEKINSKIKIINIISR